MAANRDEAIEAAENDLLIRTPAESLEQSVADILAHVSNHHPRSVDLAAQMDRLDLAAYTLLMHADEDPQDVYFLQRGRLAILVPNRHKVRSIGPGSVIGEMAYLLQSKRGGRGQG